MRFRLSYEGELRPTQRDAVGSQPDPLAVHKHRIRRAFHLQLKELWRTNKFLREHKMNPRESHIPVTQGGGWWGSEPAKERPMSEVIAEQYREFGYRFVPLVREQISLLCSLEILFLRRDIPGSIITAGDIDNRIKTIIDALRRPRSQNELVNDDIAPRDGEDPFYCLLEDDSQVSHLVVETDTLLDPATNDDADHRKARLIITVELKPYYATMFNLSFV